MIAISDTGPLISLLKAEQIDLLRIFDNVIIPNAVYEELINDKRFFKESEIIKQCEFIKVDSSDMSEDALLIRVETGLDYGESEAFALAKKLKPDYFLVEDYKAKKYAVQENIECIGSLAVLLFGFKRGIIKKADVHVATE